jgi:acetoin utilization deacetylase AcuC-like enzyme
VDYPFFWGGPDEDGEGAGKGLNRNWPLAHGTGEASYLVALDEALSVIRAFAPTYLLLSLGFDIMDGDPIPLGGGFRVGTTCLEEIARRIAKARLPTIILQEGGYNISRLGEYAVTFLQQFEPSVNPS